MQNKIFIGGLTANTDRVALQNHFHKYGGVTDAVVMYRNNHPRGFGFVTFESRASMEAALHDTQVIDNREVDCKRALPEDQAPPPKSFNSPDKLPGDGKYSDYGGMNSGNSPQAGKVVWGSSSFGKVGKGQDASDDVDKIFVGGLPQSVDTDCLRDYFSKYGEIKDCIVLMDPQSGHSRGFGFVRFHDLDAVNKAVSDYQEHRLEEKWIEVKRAIPSGKDKYPPPPYNSSPHISPSTDMSRFAPNFPSFAGMYGGYFTAQIHPDPHLYNATRVAANGFPAAYQYPSFYTPHSYPSFYTPQYNCHVEE